MTALSGGSAHGVEELIRRETQTALEHWERRDGSCIVGSPIDIMPVVFVYDLQKPATM